MGSWRDPIPNKILLFAREINSVEFPKPKKIKMIKEKRKEKDILKKRKKK